jgi:putative DNA methylase
LHEAVQLHLEFGDTRLREEEAGVVPIDRTFPEEKANELARLESFNKHLYRPNTYLHKWWARRSGTTFRYILKQLVNHSAKSDFYAPGGLEGKVILDPMMGGGTTVHEAIRMGANIIGIDIDPIPLLQLKATLTPGDVRHKRRTFYEFVGRLEEKLGPLYQTLCPTCQAESETQFVLYGLRRRCACQEVIFVDSLLLREDTDSRRSIYICPHCGKVYSGMDHECTLQLKTPLVLRGQAQCKRCDSTYSDVLDEVYWQRYVPLVVVGRCPQHGQFFKTIDDRDLQYLEKARTALTTLNVGKGETFRVPNGPKSGDLLRRGITTYRELFSPRQLLYLEYCRELLAPLPDQDRLWLALLVSTSLEFNSMLCGYKGRGVRRPGAVRHVFSHHAYSFPYTALENNPLFQAKTSGTLRRLFHDRIWKAGRWAAQPIERRIAGKDRVKARIRGEVDAAALVSEWHELADGQRKLVALQADAATMEIPEGLVDYVVTDPPYYQNVQYSDLSHYFRVWLRALLPDAADWGYDPLASAVSEGDAASNRKYGDVLANIWRMCHRALDKTHGRLIFTFHHWSHEAWAELTLSLKKGGFVLVNRYVMFSENPTSVHIRDLRALKHDAILVLRPATADGESPMWPEPSQIDSTLSRSFCSDCAAALGWFLNTDLADDEVREEWRRLLGETRNAKAPC